MQYDNEELNKLGAHIKSLRTAKKLTLSSMCYKNEIDPATLSRIEKGQVDPKYLTLLKIAKAFNIKYSELVEFSDQ